MAGGSEADEKRAGATVETDVLVVGAGPTGLMLANWLRRLGIRVVVVDAKSGTTRESRAIVVQARSMEIYEQLGLIDEVLPRVTTIRLLAPGFERTRFSTIPIGALGAGLTRFASLSVLEQSRNEALLYENLRSVGGDVLWRHSLASITEIEGTDGADGGIEAVPADPAAPRIRARFCVGADGAGSFVRQSRGIAFEGTTNAHVFYVCDAIGVTGLTADAVNVVPSPRDVLLTFPLGDGDHHRLIGIARAPLGEQAGAVEEGPVRALLEREFGVTWGRSTWFATYRVHHRVAARFRDGPFFLAGDAAHVHSPVGAQGMNTGLQDAHNLALKLAEVISGTADVAWLDHYEIERRPVAQRLIRSTDRVFAAVTSDTRRARLARRALVPALAPLLTRVIPRVGGASRLFGYLSQIRVHYWASGSEKARARGSRDPVVGRRLPWTGENHACLAAVEWQVHSYGGGAVRREQGDRIGETLGMAAVHFATTGGSLLSVDDVYLVRPDGFVAARARPAVALAVFRARLAEFGRTRPVGPVAG
ncbi:MAG: FAD-dependent monooxygenase [Burkholderiaceae bacterium]|nr:FAD-dependent monooxygenase [Microbacteriaceae bacterium]